MTNERVRAVLDRIGALSDVDRKDQVFGASRHRWGAQPPLTPEELELLELEAGTLPDEHREFVSNVARGGAGPYYGLEPVGTWIQPEHPMGGAPASRRAPFFGDGSQGWDAGHFENGTLYLAEQGCGMYSVLVLNGPHRGEVWTLDYSIPALRPEAPSFLAWMEQWIEGAHAEWARRAVPAIADGQAPRALLDSPAIRFFARPALMREAEAGEPEAMRALGLLGALDGDAGAAAWLDRAAAAETKEPEARRQLDRARVGRLSQDHEVVLAACIAGLATPKIWASTRSTLLQMQLEALDALGRHDAALEIAEALAQHTFFVHGPHFELAERWIRKERWDEVERVLRRAMVRPPAGPESLRRSPRANADVVLSAFVERLEVRGLTERVRWARTLSEGLSDTAPPDPFAPRTESEDDAEN